MIRHTIFTCFFFASATILNAQPNAELPNNEFDNWSSLYNPDGWGTIESAFQSDFGITVKDTDDKKNGAASLKLITSELNGSKQYGLAAVGRTWYRTNPHGIRIQGIPYTSRPDTLWLLYKYTTPGSDTAAVQMGLYANPTGAQQEFSLQVIYAISPKTEWTLRPFKLSSKYSSTQTPDSIIFNLYSSYTNANRTIGSTLQVDGVYFNSPGNVTSIHDMDKAGADLKIYPNPANGKFISLKTEADLKGCQFEVHSISGKDVIRFKLDGSKRSFDISSLSSGPYLWLLVDKAGGIVNKGKLIKTN
ncbi:T9SS type A sorting domain-containing protein [Taibaiella lutea]|uniref:T9SS type A sorting domain-containing protein n=1 Tax=Taibaiella lutea TaxID=2608001 RepID=A0A5M6CP79_9BACT|nr:T9SS type A sorting domain-containing protein [Taibaiella lutea]KAA5535045.1 T9SS type A sorting domain-containing protein [Taibaiella lutea]